MRSRGLPVVLNRDRPGKGPGLAPARRNALELESCSCEAWADSPPAGLWMSSGIYYFLVIVRGKEDLAPRHLLSQVEQELLIALLQARQ